MADLTALTVMVIAAGVIIVVATIVARRRNEQHGGHTDRTAVNRGQIGARKR
jgi:hypothetical protein